MPPDVRQAARCALDRKASAVTVLDLRNLSPATDFFVVATGRSDVQVRAIADYIDYVVHVFHPAVRDFYRLEELWGDAQSMVLEEA